MALSECPGAGRNARMPSPHSINDPRDINAPIGVVILAVQKRDCRRRAADLSELPLRCHPIRTQQLCLLEHGLHGFLLQIGRVAVLVEDAFDHHLDLGAGAFAQGPVDGDAFLDLGDQFGQRTGEELDTLPKNWTLEVPKNWTLEKLDEPKNWTLEDLDTLFLQRRPALRPGALIQAHRLAQSSPRRWLR